MNSDWSHINSNIAHQIQISYRISYIIPHSYPLMGAVIYHNLETFGNLSVPILVHDQVSDRQQGPVGPIHLGPVGPIHLDPVGPIHLGPGPGPIWARALLGPFVPFYVFVTNGVTIKDGELSGTSL